MDPWDQQEKIDRDQEQERYARRFVTVPFEVMLDERLTLTDKFVFGRALGFYEFFESAEKTAAFIGVSADQVRKSKQKLEKLGLIKCFLNDGRGKRYTAELDARKMQISEERRITLEEKPNVTRQKNQSDSEKEPPYNKAENKTENSSKDKSFEEAPAPTDESEIEPLKEEQPKSYGKAEINDLLELWLEETGFDHKSAKAERYAINNLLRKNGYEATKSLIRRVGRARRSDSQFAPQIAKPSQLQGKYSKLEALVIWEEREAKKQQTEIDAKPAGPIVPRFTPYEDAREGKTEEELRAECQAIRDKYKGTKFEKIFGGRK
jgi:hypothetical protein